MDLSFKTLLGAFFIIWGISIVFDINIGRFIFPLLLIFFGISLLFNYQWNVGDKNSETTQDKSLNYSTAFGSINRKIETDNFRGGKIDIVFGGGEIDLRNAKIKKGETAKLEVNTVFGGIKIRVPENWAVNSSVTGVFGGFENNIKQPASDKEEGRLELKGAAVFGGGEISN